MVKYASVKFLKLAAASGNQHFAYSKNKDADQLCSTAQLICAFVFASRLVRFIFFLNPKLQASSHIPCLYCPVWELHCKFSHDELKCCFYSQTSHPKAKNRSTRDRKICDTQKKKKEKQTYSAKCYVKSKIN